MPLYVRNHRLAWFQKPAPAQVGVLDAVDVVFLVGEQLTVIDTKVVELRHIDGVIGSPIVRLDNGIRLDAIGYDRHQRFTRRIRDHLRVDLAASFQQSENGNFPRSTPPTLAFAVSAKACLCEGEDSSSRVRSRRRTDCHHPVHTRSSHEFSDSTAQQYSPDCLKYSLPLAPSPLQRTFPAASIAW